MSPLAVGVLALLFGLILGTVLGHALASAPPMPTCALCQQELNSCTCYGPKRAEARAGQALNQTHGGH